MRTTISIPEPLLENARRAARKKGMTLSAFVEDALRFHMSRDHASPPSKFRLHTVRGKLVDPALDLDRTAALLLADDEARFAGRKR
jgi:ribbon-helix-helix CopG family protein